MNPLEYIEKGINTGDWEKVTEGYERLTGKTLLTPNTIARSIHFLENTLREISERCLTSVEIAKNALEENTGSEVDKPIINSKEKPKKKRNYKRKKQSDKNDDEGDSSLQLDVNKRTVIQREVGEVQLITNDPDPEEIEKNKIKAKRSQGNKIKLKRQADKTYDVPCNECEQLFKSNRPSGEIGQKCSKCLRNKKR